MGERTTDSLTSTGGINWEARSGFHERIKWKMEQKVKDQAKLISELKDDLIEALKTRDQEAEWVNLARDNVELRQKLAAGLTSYQAEIKRGDALLIERGDYAAEVLTLKADLAAMQTDNCVLMARSNDQILEDGEIIKKQKAEVERLKEEVERLNRVHVDLMICMDEPQRVAARHIAEENELRAEIRDLKDKLDHATHLYQEELRTEKIGREKMASKSRRIIELEDVLSEARSIIKSWVPIVESYAGRKMNEAEKAKWND